MLNADVIDLIGICAKSIHSRIRKPRSGDTDGDKDEMFPPSSDQTTTTRIERRCGVRFNSPNPGGTFLLRERPWSGN
jgi:hypothetical protein